MSWRHLLWRLGTPRGAKQELRFLEELLEITYDNFPETKQKSEHGSIVSALLPLLAPTLPNPDAGKQVLWLLQFKDFRTLNANMTSRVLLKAVTQAINKNDAPFFIRLGRRLSERPKPLEKEHNLNPLKILMLVNWVRIDVSQLQFCYFTDQALADFLTKVTPEAGATLHGVRSTRKRLKLLQAKPRLVKKVSEKNGAIYLS